MKFCGIFFETALLQRYTTSWLFVQSTSHAHLRFNIIALARIHTRMAPRVLHFSTFIVLMYCLELAISFSISSLRSLIHNALSVPATLQLVWFPDPSLYKHTRERGKKGLVKWSHGSWNVS